MTDVGDTLIDEAPDEIAAAARRRVDLTRVREGLVLYAACVAAALAIAALLVAATGGAWDDVFSAIVDGAVRRPGRIGLTIGFATPILLVALGTIVNARAGLVNIGQEGQLVIGASCATYIGTRLGGPGPLVLVIAMVGGVIGGASWAGIAAVLRDRRGVPEVLSTLLLTTVAFNVMGYALGRRWLLLAPAEGRANRNQVSEQLAPDTRIPRVTWFGNEFPISAVLAVALAITLAFALARTVVGFRLSMLGRNPSTAKRAGVDEHRYGITALLVSGGFAGLAGGVMLAGGDFANYQLVNNFGAGIGFAGLLAALVARERALVAIAVAFVFGGLRSGTGFLRATGVSGRIADVVQGLLVLALLLPPAILYLRARRRALALPRERA